MSSEGIETVHGDPAGSLSAGAPASDLAGCVRYLAHELRNSLSATTGWVHVMRQTGVPAGMTKAIEAIERNLRLHTTQMEDLLDAVAIGSGRPLPVASSIQIAPPIEQARNDVAALAQRREVTVETPQSDQAAGVAIDQDRLRRMVSALLRVVVETVPPKSTVSIRTASTATGVDIGVAGVSPTLSPAEVPVSVQLVAVMAELHGGQLTALGSDRNSATAFSLHLPRG